MIVMHVKLRERTDTIILSFSQCETMRDVLASLTVRPDRPDNIAHVIDDSGRELFVHREEIQAILVLNPKVEAEFAADVNRISQSAMERKIVPPSPTIFR